MRNLDEAHGSRSPRSPRPGEGGGGIPDGPAFIGLDVGSSLVKLAQGGATGAAEFSTWPLRELEQVKSFVEHARPARIGATGCGASRLLPELSSPGIRVDEFEAWGAGCARMLGNERPKRHLLVSVGTGTSVILSDDDALTRVGGTALGGGTVLGLAQGLLGTREFPEICRLAEDGDRTLVDLCIKDIYSSGEIALAPEATASAFAKLDADDRPADVAAAIMNLVGENIGLICGGLAALTQTDDIVYGGSTLQRNPTMVAHLERLSGAYGRKARILPDGSYTGALGALVHASEEDDQSR